jgi:hypothetical protein
MTRRALACRAGVAIVALLVSITERLRVARR